MRRAFWIFSLFGLLIFNSSHANAGQPRLLETYGKWAAYVFIEDGNKVCYMASQPQKAEGNYSRRGDIFALVTHRPAEGTKDVFSYITGYAYKAGSSASVTIDGEKVVLFTQDDTAWAQDTETDTKLANMIKKGSTMVVRGTSSRGTLTEDTFSLKGSSKAYDKITSECGL